MKQKILLLFLVLVGSVRALADVGGFPEVSAFFSLFNVSPAMKVFTAHKGYETFSPTFMLDFHGRESETVSVELTPELYRKLEGPYNRRNVYGAVISYGPVLVSNLKTANLFHSVARYSFCKPGKLIEELSITVPDDFSGVTIRYLHQADVNTEYPEKLEVSCG